MSYDESTKNRLDLRDTTMLSIRRELAHKEASTSSKKDLFIISSLTLVAPTRVQLTENSMKKIYSTIHFPPTCPIPIALPHSCQSAH